MIQELMVALSCLSNHGCSETIHVYYAYNPIVERMVVNDTKRVSKYVGHDVAILAPIVFIMAGGSGSVRLTTYFSLDVSRNDKLFSFKYDF